MFPMWLPFPESEFKSSAVVIKCLLVSACTFMYIVFCMIFLALMIYCVWLLKMQQAKIHKCNWDSYDMAANPSADMTALIINNLRVFGCEVEIWYFRRVSYYCKFRKCRFWDGLQMTSECRCKETVFNG
ncbi:hypothetical protein HUJ04_001428 [Dendroctonus ponderosae]|nr:hypothetical protein HUJ04_001428 [Dendroctonus ponderosae]